MQYTHSHTQMTCTLTLVRVWLVLYLVFGRVAYTTSSHGCLGCEVHLKQTFFFFCLFFFYHMMTDNVFCLSYCRYFLRTALIVHLSVVMYLLQVWAVMSAPTPPVSTL